MRNIKLTSTTTFRRILLGLAIAVFLDGVSTFAALSVGLREGNPLVNPLGGPSTSLIIRAIVIAFMAYRSKTWDKPHRIAVINATGILATLITLAVVAQNFYITYMVLNE